jgi:hypothetical protein
MKRALLTGTFYTLAGVATLLLAASIFYSCRSGGDPHHSGSAATYHAPPVETTRSAQFPRPTNKQRISHAHHLSVPISRVTEEGAAE